MTLEYATLRVAPGSEEDFVEAYLATQALLDGAMGLRSASLARGVEEPSTFVLRVEWESVKAHEAFRATEEFAGWRARVGPFLAEAPQAAHYETVTPRV